MVTAYDFPSAMHVRRANIDVILVGDSAAMVELGYDTTQPMTLDQMLHHCQAVHRGVTASMNRSSAKKPKKPLLVGDMPFGTYEYNDLDIALKNSYRMVKEGGMDAVKMEGGSVHRANAIRHVVNGGGKIISYSISACHSFHADCLMSFASIHIYTLHHGSYTNQKLR
jgi:3-methyl-2-oxobutanoate hydroxymethyltransferase